MVYNLLVMMTLTIDRTAFEEVLTQQATVMGLVQSGAATLEGDASGLEALFGALVEFELLFEMMPGTG